LGAARQISRGENPSVVIHQSNVDTQERADHSAQNWQSVLEGLKALVESGG
jgi:hypothetical protein